MGNHAAQAPAICRVIAIDKMRQPVTDFICAIGRLGLVGCWVAGDAPAPRIGLLLAGAIRVWQLIISRYIHHDKWREQHLKTALLQILNRRHYRGIARGAAKCRAPINSRNQIGGLAVKPGHLPVARHYVFKVAFNPRF